MTDPLPADDLARFAAATEELIKEDQTRAFTRSLFAPRDGAEETTTAPTDTGPNQVPGEGHNPPDDSRSDRDLRRFVAGLFGNNPDYS